MKIGIISQAYFPIYGGVTEHVHHTAENLKKRGHEVTIITSFFNRGDEQWSEDVIRVGRDFPIPHNWSFGNVTMGVDLGEQLKEIEKEKKFDIIHIHGALEPVLPLVAIKYMKAPKVGTFHSFMEKSLGYHFFQKGFADYMDKLSGRIYVSEASRKFIEKYFQGPYRIIPNGVDIERFKPENEPIEKFDDDKINILFVGRLEPRKGLKYLLQAFKYVREKYLQTRLIIVGNGILKYYYMGFQDKELTANIHYEGRVSADNIPRYYATADVFCAPSTTGESFGIVLLEAMASGKAIVASDILGYRQILDDGKQGLMIKPQDPFDLTDKLIKLVADQKLRKKMGIAGREKSLDYSWEKITKEIEKYYLDILNKPKNSSTEPKKSQKIKLK